jgi:hypothetical protein
MRTAFLLLSLALLVVLCTNNPSSPNTDPCAGVTCLNGGTCVDGVCECPAGYTGAHCETAVDPCAGVTCQNGGHCDNGVCVCPAGFAGTYCQTAVDPCAAITCLNGGYCVNGLCSCPEGYTGPDCGQERTPSAINITKIEVTDWPPTKPSGAGWDLLDGPDIYLMIGRGTTYIDTTGVASNLIPGQTATYTNGFPVRLDYPTMQHWILAFDYDPGDIIDGDDEMDGYSFSPWTSGTGFPSTKTLDLAGLPTMVLYLSYVF